MARYGVEPGTQQQRPEKKLFLLRLHLWDLGYQYNFQIYCLLQDGRRYQGETCAAP